MDVYKWQEIPTEQISPTQSRKVIHTERATVVRLVTEKDTAIPLHNHVHEQVTMVVSGSLRFEMQGESATLRSGRDPANTVGCPPSGAGARGFGHYRAFRSGARRLEALGLDFLSTSIIELDQGELQNEA